MRPGLQERENTRVVRRTIRLLSVLLNNKADPFDKLRAGSSPSAQDYRRGAA